MTWDNKVIWSEGLFLQPQHLQQQERYLERMIRASTAAMTPFGYGLTRLEIDADLLTLGKFGLRSAAGIMPDGTPFRMPGDDDQPEPLDLPETLRNTTLHLSLPGRQPGAIDTATADRAETAARFVVTEHTAVDTSAGYQSEAVVPIGRLRFRLLTEHELTGGYVALGLIRILEVRADRSIVLDETYIPPILVTEVSAKLTGDLAHLQGLLHQRAESRAGRVADTPHRGAAEISDFLILQICNRYEVLLAHLAACVGQLHPELVYRVLIQLAGDLATFIDSRKRPPTFPPYRHEDLQATFRPVIAALRQYCSSVDEQTAVPIPLQERRLGIRVGPIMERALVTDATWVLAVKSQIPPESLRANLPNQIKIGPVEQIRELINVALRGIEIRALPVAPRELPYYSGTSYFEMDRSSPYWAALARSGGIAIQVQGDIPGLEIECWAIRG
jgi:type VI secretion system protein ImpJ